MENRAPCLSNTTRTSRSPRCSARRRCARRSRRSTPSPAPPTTSPTKATPSPSERLAALAAYRAALAATAAGRPASALAAGVRAARRGDRPPPPAGRAARRPARRLHPGRDRVTATPTAPALLDYCRRSANPVGRLLLHLYGVGGAEHLARSDAICTALQLANFWQDLGVDTRRGRLYLPEADCRRHGVDPLELLAGKDSAAVASPSSPMLVAWARELMLSRRAAGPRGAGPRRLGAAPRGPGRAARARAHRPARRRDLAAAPEARLERRAGDRLARPGDAPREGRGERARRVMARRPPGTARAMTPEQYVQDKAARQRLELLLRLPLPAAAAPGGDHRVLCLLPRGRRRRRRGLRPRRRRRQARLVARRGRRELGPASRAIR